MLPSGIDRPRVRLAILGLILLAAGGAALTGGPSLVGVQQRVDDAGAWGPLVFVAVYAGLTVALVPGTALTLVSGALFGPARGAAYAVCGATIGATMAFAIGRALGRDGVRQLLGPRLPRVEAALDTTGFGAMVILRVLPVVPFNGLNYAAGVTGIRVAPYVAATVLGILPGTVAVAVAGSSLTDPTSPAFLGSLAAGGALLVGSLLYARRRARAVDA